MALFQHRMAGGDEASAPVIAPPSVSAASLDTFKSNLNNLTQSLASSIPFPRGNKPASSGAPMTHEQHQQVRVGRYSSRV